VLLIEIDKAVEKRARVYNNRMASMLSEDEITSPFAADKVLKNGKAGSRLKTLAASGGDNQTLRFDRTAHRL
jgi:hypothetical protein